MDVVTSLSLENQLLLFLLMRGGSKGGPKDRDLERSIRFEPFGDRLEAVTHELSKRFAVAGLLDSRSDYDYRDATRYLSHVLDRSRHLAIRGARASSLDDEEKSHQQTEELRRAIIDIYERFGRRSSRYFMRDASHRLDYLVREGFI